MRLHGLASWLHRHAPSLYTALKAVAGDAGADLRCRIRPRSSPWRRGHGIFWPKPLWPGSTRSLPARGGQSQHASVNWLGARLIDLIGLA